MLKRLIGERLRESSHYNGLLEEMSRCWRLSYANEFHLDITPSIRNPSCQAGGELVPDRKVEQWKPSNPKGYRKWFEERARLQPRMNLAKVALAEGQRADLQPFPTRMALKGPHNDWLQSRDQLRSFRKALRPLLDVIKARHGQTTLLHIFPAVPVATAIELGRVRMPKADMPWRIYDQVNEREGFVLSVEVGVMRGQKQNRRQS